MKLVVVKYNAGNVQSVFFALARLGITPTWSDEREEILSADKVIFPGVGEAGSAMRYLREKGLDKILLEVKAPILGICLGMQLLCTHSEEGDTECLGVFNTCVSRFPNTAKVPHVGWNQLQNLKTSLFKTDVPELSDVYFVHSYYVPLIDETIATTEYNLSFSAAIHKDNYYGVQFHPEKSGSVGENILKNFLAL